MNRSTFLIPTFLASATLAALVGLAGCSDGNHSRYPDQTSETKARAQVLRDDAERRTELVDRNLAQTMTSLGFRTTQMEQRSVQAREKIAIELSAVTQPILAREEAAKAALTRGQDASDRELATALVDAKPDQVAGLKAAADDRRTALLRTTAEATREGEATMTKAKEEAARKVAADAEVVAKETAVIAKERMEAERTAREARLAIAVATTTRLDDLGEKSAERRSDDDRRASEGVSQGTKVNAAVREELGRHGSADRDITVNSTDGVVTLVGTVPHEAARRDILQGVAKVSGVVRVEDQLTVR